MIACVVSLMDGNICWAQNKRKFRCAVCCTLGGQFSAWVIALTRNLQLPNRQVGGKCQAVKSWHYKNSTTQLTIWQQSGDNSADNAQCQLPWLTIRHQPCLKQPFSTLFNGSFGKFVLGSLWRQGIWGLRSSPSGQLKRIMVTTSREVIQEWKESAH